MCDIYLLQLFTWWNPAKCCERGHLHALLPLLPWTLQEEGIQSSGMQTIPVWHCRTTTPSSLCPSPHVSDGDSHFGQCIDQTPFSGVFR
jgi:hypothetical protein